ncbi:MAG TPA: DASS family sodium-coupled anion symporter [Gemmatimonadaceae bacterium]|nr:DASS family sodium-coupled anion symporter [Gemmatimonadaceae bacterium]
MSAEPPEAPAEAAAAPRRVLVLAAGPFTAVVLFLLAPESLPVAARQVLGLAGWMAVWWVTEPVPLAATSLLPVAVLPALGVASARDAAAPYANELVFLFLAGFLLAAALEHWQAHSRIAYALIAAIGVTGRRVILGVMVATAFISMWISNTATAAMMYPITLAIGALFGAGEDARRTRTALMLGMAYAASIGGMGSLLGTPPNLIFAGAAQQLAGRSVSFTEFLAIGAPLAALLLPLCWALLVFVLYRANASLGTDAHRLIADRRQALGPLRGGEALTLAVFAATAIAWVLRERKEIGGVVIPGLVDLAPRLSDATIGVLGAVLLFVVRGASRDGARRPLLTWDEARRIPWDVLLLFGGGLSLAAAMESTGLASWLGDQMTGLGAMPPVLIYLGLAVTVLLLSELASNTAIATMVMPIAASLGEAVQQPPLLLMLVAALAASTGFALPIATPPNTIVFGSGQVTVRQMARAGIVLDLVAVLLIVAIAVALYPFVLG